MTEFRIEKDTLGEVRVPKERLYGAQTARSLANFPIGTEKMPVGVIRALLLIKKAAALVNHEEGLLPQDKKELITRAVDRLLEHFPEKEFPLAVWQTGSGTQTNMNVNEVIANTISDMTGDLRGSKRPVHPNDDVNMSQSSNDVIPTAISIASYLAIHEQLLPNLDLLEEGLRAKAKEFWHVIKVGRTHLMDAVPMSLGQEFLAFADQVAHGKEALVATMTHLGELAIGGTAVGTGLNTPEGFSKKMAQQLSRLTNHTFTPARNKFEALATGDAALSTAGAFRRLAVAFLKIAGDIAMLASGPFCGLNELLIPENEPGSSIMPGKVNPTQCESLQQVACQVMGLMSAIDFAATRSNFQLNLYRPLIAHNLLTAARLLGDAALNFKGRCLDGITPNEKKLRYNVSHSLMVVTALNPHIGYEKAAKMAQYAGEHGVSLEEAGTHLGFLTAEQFRLWANPLKMAFPHE